jgi:hypothetical protein
LTDEKWRTMLDEDQALPLADWMSSFITPQGEQADLTRAVFQFQNMLTNAYWSLSYGGYIDPNPALSPFKAELESLMAGKQYVSHQLVSSLLRSFDRQSDSKAVVTTRETWQDKLYKYSGDYANYDEQPTFERGPYTLDATYMLEKVDNVWQVTNVVYASQPPAWSQ